MKTVIQTVAIVALVAVGSVANAGGERLLAHKFAKTVIVAHMKSPASAVVCPWDDLRELRVANLFCGDDQVEGVLVTGWIDASNSFGAKIRSRWQVLMVEGTVITYGINDEEFTLVRGYVVGQQNTPSKVEARRQAEEEADRAHRMAVRMAPVVADAKQLAAIHAQALGARVSTLTKKQAEARAKSLVAIGLRRVKATGVDAKNAWIEAYVGEILSH